MAEMLIVNTLHKYLKRFVFYVVLNFDKKILYYVATHLHFFFMICNQNIQIYRKNIKRKKILRLAIFDL